MAYEQAFLFIDRQLKRLQPSAQPKARQTTPILEDLEALWQQMTLTEQRTILQAMFTRFYFDAPNHLRKVAAHNPFDRLLGWVKNGFASILTWFISGS